MKLIVCGAAVVLLALAGCGSGNGAPKASTGSKTRVIAPSHEAAAPSPQPFNVSGYLAGTAKPKFAAGAPGKISIVSIGPLVKDGTGSASLPVAYRNNTPAGVAHVDLTATARLRGQLVATGQSQGETPAQIQPGEVGFAFIYFEDSKSMPDRGLTYQFTSEHEAADTTSYNTAPLTVKELTYNGSSIVGTARNATGKSVTGPYDVQIYCFKGNRLRNEVGSFADQDGNVAAGGSVSFTTDLYDTKCRSFTVGVSGFFN